MEIKDLQLTENDFKLLIDGLDALPEKGMAGEMMSDLVIGIITHDKKGDRNEISAMERKRDHERKSKEKEKDALIEEAAILKGKLLMFKRYLIETNALHQVNEMLKK